MLSPRRAPKLGKIHRRACLRLIPFPGTGDILLAPTMISHMLAYVAPTTRHLAPTVGPGAPSSGDLFWTGTLFLPSERSQPGTPDVRGELVGDEGLVKEIGEAARRADVGDALQRVVASAIGRAGLATLAGEEEGSRPEQVSGRRCTRPHGGRQMSGGRCDICQRVAYHCGSQ